MFVISRDEFNDISYYFGDSVSKIVSFGFIEFFEADKIIVEDFGLNAAHFRVKFFDIFDGLAFSVDVCLREDPISEINNGLSTKTLSVRVRG